jgi:hypothetical protein
VFSGSVSADLALCSPNVKYLLLREWGGDLNVPVDNERRTMLHLAASTGDAKLVKMLVELGETVNMSSLSGETPLHAAVAAVVDRAPRLQTVQLLVGCKADVRSKNASGETPLQLARRLGRRTDLEQCLLPIQAESGAGPVVVGDSQQGAATSPVPGRGDAKNLPVELKVSGPRSPLFHGWFCAAIFDGIPDGCRKSSPGATSRFSVRSGCGCDVPGGSCCSHREL